MKKIYLIFQLYVMLFSFELSATLRGTMQEIYVNDHSYDSCSSSCSWGPLRQPSLGPESTLSNHLMTGTESDEESSGITHQDVVNTQFSNAYKEFKSLLERLSKNSQGYKLKVGQTASYNFRDFAEGVYQVFQVKSRSKGERFIQNSLIAQELLKKLVNLERWHQEITIDPQVMKLLKINDFVMQQLMRHLDILIQLSRRHVNDLMEDE